MVNTGEWGVLSQVGVPYYEKPPLGYWLNALSITVFGHNNFAVRFPTAFSVGITALAIFFFVAHLRKNRMTAALAAIIYATFLEVFGVGTFAVLDSMFAMFVVLMMFAYYLGNVKSGWPSVAWQVLAGVACSGAFLTKGFTAIVIAAATSVLWFIWEKKLLKLLAAPWIPLGVAVLITLPPAWFVARHNPDFWNYFVWVEHAQRFVDPHGGQHVKSFLFYIPVVIVGAIPWTFFAPQVIGGLKSKVKSDVLTRYCLSWFIMQFLFFSACKGKLPTYILVGFAPLAILFADYFSSERKPEANRRSSNAAAVVLLVALVGFLIWLPYSQDSILRTTMLSSPDAKYLIMSVLATIACFFLAAHNFRKSRHYRGVFEIALGFCILKFASFTFLPSQFEDNKSPMRLLQETMQLYPEDAVVIADRNTIVAACWLYKRHDAYLFADAGELLYGFSKPEYAGRRLKNGEKALTMFQKALADGKPVVVVMRNNYFSFLGPGFDAYDPVFQVGNERFLWKLYLPEGWKQPQKVIEVG